MADTDNPQETDPDDAIEPGVVAGAPGPSGSEGGPGGDPDARFTPPSPDELRRLGEETAERDRGA
ncbi:MAG: hypothetical protein JWM48_1660 [Mycobacterium sp.]|jgi:hypothetical protein|nr:hypothetical protein [Mycobacterium sp.]MCW2745110.1 hypothetical protein [Mycobacterium sp.]